MSLITSADFIDLYVGEDFADVKGLAGAGELRVPVPAAWEDEVEALRQRCKQVYHEGLDPEFSIVIDDVLLRVTQLEQAFDGSIFVLRKSSAQIRDFAELGFPEAVVQAVMAQDLRGLVLICGDMATGKTSTAASLLVARLREHGGVAFAVEDPTETNTNGPHGRGRCIQVKTSRRSGGYSEALTRTLRTGADLVLVGEVRDEDTAYQVCKAALNGHLVLTTMHAKTGVQAIEKLVTLAKAQAANAYEIVSEGLQVVICQFLEQQGSKRHLVAEPLLLTGDDQSAIRDKIRRANIHLIEEDLDRQHREGLWG